MQIELSVNTLQKLVRLIPGRNTANVHVSVVIFLLHNFHILRMSRPQKYQENYIIVFCFIFVKQNTITLKFSPLRVLARFLVWSAIFTNDKNTF